jgi:hypothetical protein
MHFDLFDPVLYILECFSLVDCKREYYAHGSSIVGLSDSLELLLTCCIPYLQPDSVFANHDGLDFEIDSDRCKVGTHEIVIAEFEKHVCLAHSAVPNHQQFDVIIIVLASLHFKNYIF